MKIKNHPSNSLINQLRVIIIYIQDKSNTSVKNNVSWKWEKLQINHTDLENYTNLTDGV